MAAQPLYLSHPSSLEHETGGHPERGQRIIAIEAELARLDWLGFVREQSPRADRAALQRVHTAAHVDLIEQASSEGGGRLDADTIVSPGSYTAALHAAGGAIELARRVHAETGVGLSAHRPPGHHATRDRAMGFCLFNSVAVAAQYALDQLGVERVLILDWDVHHGNGTNDIFWATDQVLFVSVHQSPLYPGSGRATELGAGAGHGYTVNLPVPPGAGDDVFVSMVRDVAAPLARIYAPRLILVSAGFDAHLDDPLANCTVTEAGFDAMTAVTRDLAKELDVGLGLILEGGYDTNALARSVAASMAALKGGGPADLDSRHPLATAALNQLAPLWPALTP